MKGRVGCVACMRRVGRSAGRQTVCEGSPGMGQAPCGATGMPGAWAMRRQTCERWQAFVGRGFAAECGARAPRGYMRGRRGAACEIGVHVAREQCNGVQVAYRWCSQEGWRWGHHAACQSWRPVSPTPLLRTPVFCFAAFMILRACSGASPRCTKFSSVDAAKSSTPKAKHNLEA